jgi:hypothetical protein
MNEKEADVIACVRTIVFISYLATNLYKLDLEQLTHRGSYRRLDATGTIDGCN